jgi:hypothetical protein
MIRAVGFMFAKSSCKDAFDCASCMCCTTHVSGYLASSQPSLLEQMPITMPPACAILSIFHCSYIDVLKDSLSCCNSCFRVVGLTWRLVETPDQVQIALREGSRARATASTALNAASSRSHALVSVKVQCIRDGVTATSMLHLVDLAGEGGA